MILPATVTAFNSKPPSDPAGFALDEKVWIDGVEKTSTFAWDYDELGRLTDEVFTSYDELLSQTQHFTFDMNGNRLALLVDQGNNGTIDKATTYAYDVNDRLLTETAGNRQSTYAYNHTEQISKTTVDTSTAETLASVAFTWTPDDRMASITTTEYASGAPVSARRTAYGYDDGGVRVSAKISLDASASGTFTHSATTQYLNDGFNPTGYSQVVQEITTDASDAELSKTVYSFGAKRIGQTVYDSANPTGLSSFYLMDGHGSTRVLSDAIGAIMTIGGVRQIFVYDAHGNMVNIESSAAGTTIQYDGEQFDWQTGFLNLRRRLYDAQAGRFLGSDPYGGREDNPQTFHKYAFTHGDPVNGRDPGGNMLILLDGTSNDPNDTYEGASTPTAIWKFKKLADASPGVGPYVGYFPGVGNHITDDHWWERSFATDIEDVQIDPAMMFVDMAAAYGDNEFNVIGFSRGAIAATELSMRVAEKYPNLEINFVGLFDPVGSMGYAGQFRSTVRGTLPSQVKHAWQAVAHDENRQNFAATFIPGANYQFFPGSHGDVGGGFADHGLADLCMKWMWQKAKIAGLDFADPATALSTTLYAPDSDGENHPSPYSYWYTYTGKGAARDTVTGVNRTIENVIFRRADFYFNMTIGIDQMAHSPTYTPPPIVRPSPNLGSLGGGFFVGF